MLKLSADPIAEKLAVLKEKNPHAYPRDYAAMLGVSEAELTPVFYPERIFEIFDLEAVLASLSRLKRVKLMARTGFAVFELFKQVDFKRDGGALVLAGDSCFVALNPAGLGKIYFLSPAAEKDKAAVLIFDRAGVAALKIYIEPHEFDIALLKAEAKETAGESVDTAALLDRARPPVTAVASDITPRRLIEKAAAQKEKIGFELATKAVGVFMQHVPAKVVDARGWFNILDEDFNLHLKEEAMKGAAESIKLWRVS